jgi:hypothetical protein
LALFYEHSSFVSSIESKKIEKHWWMLIGWILYMKNWITSQEIKNKN